MNVTCAVDDNIPNKEIKKQILKLIDLAKKILEILHENSGRSHWLTCLNLFNITFVGSWKFLFIF